MPRPKSNWLETVKGLIEQNPTNLRCVGGPNTIRFIPARNPIGGWINMRFGHVGDVQRHLRQGEFFSGSNMIWLRECAGDYMAALKSTRV